MTKLLMVVVLGMVLSVNTFYGNPSHKKTEIENDKSLALDVEKPNEFDRIKSLYDSLNVSKILKYEAFEEAMLGYQNLKNIRNKDIITVIDFTLPSTAKRMYVIDLKHKKLLYHTIVSHGRNSGDNYATSFSNRHGSFQSSLGFYLTGETYQGGNGFSLRLDGLEKGINDQARPRAVVIHGADYCSASMIKNVGRLGRSYGCPALPRELNKPIVNTIKNGSMLYIYANNKQYASSSAFLKTKIAAKKTMLAQHEDADTGVEKTLIN